MCSTMSIEGKEIVYNDVKSWEKQYPSVGDWQIN